MPQYSQFWLDFCAGAPLAPIWGWKDRARGLPSWAPALLSTLEASGCAYTAAQACGRSLPTLATARALLPGLTHAWDAAIARYQAQLLPNGQQFPESGMNNAPIGDSPIGESGGAAEVAHPLEDLPMGDWLRLPHAEHAAIVVDYAGRTPRRAVTAGDLRRRGGR